MANSVSTWACPHLTSNHITGTSDFEQNVCLKGKNVKVILFQGGARNASDQRCFILRGRKNTATLESSSVLLRYLQVSHLLNTQSILGERLEFYHLEEYRTGEIVMPNKETSCIVA